MSASPVRLSRGLKAGSPLALVLFAVAGGNDAGAWLEATAFVGLVIVSAAVHEVGHVLAVRSAGLDVRRVTLTLFGGSTHYAGLPPTRAGSAAIAAAGPLASAFLATGLLATWVLAGESDGGAAAVAGSGVVMNASITVINLLPLPGFDGGRILAAFLRRRRRKSERPPQASRGAGSSSG
ncbi:MAG TPA: site-2 protease family protein [Acidimicrobiia bacterium]|nr:site-2 protease family protein [Acidimicrobiia bacterium]